MNKDMENNVNKIKQKLEKYSVTDTNDSNITRFDQLDYLEKFKVLNGLFKEIIKGLSTDSYGTILATTAIVTKFSEHLIQPLQSFLLGYSFSKQDSDINKEYKDIGFLAFYTLGVYYYRTKDSEQLRDHILKYIEFYLNEKDKDIYNIQYILFYDTLIRYFSIRNDFKRQLLMNQILEKATYTKYTNELIELENGSKISSKNPAIKMSYASCIVAMEEYLIINKDSKERKGVDEEKLEDYNVEKIRTIIENKENAPITSSFLDSIINDSQNKEKLNALLLIDECINFNDKYSRYKFIKSKIIFYDYLYQAIKVAKSNSELTNFAEAKRNATEELNKAIKQETESNNGIGLIDEFNQFKAFIDSFPDKIDDFLHSSNGIYLKNKSQVYQSKNIQISIKPNTNCEGDNDYLFISYSSLDYKYVYSDLFEMERRGIRFFYDVDLTPNVSNQEKLEKWYDVISQKIEHSAAVVLFLSKNSISSEAVLKELEYANKHNKIIYVIDLSGFNTVSKLIKNYLSSSGGTLSSRALKILTTNIDDDISNFNRSADLTSTKHIISLYNTLLNGKFKNIIDNYIIDYAGPIKGNNHGGECEDALGHLDNERFFVICDGVSRKEEEYADGLIHATKVSSIFVDKSIENFKNRLNKGIDQADIPRILIDCAINADKCIKEYNDKNKEQIESIEQPGCCFMFAYIFRGKLYYAGGGDSTIILYRNNKPIILFQEQTYYVFNIQNIENDRISLVNEYINNSNNPYGYALANGELNQELIQSNSIDLEIGDVVIITTDGASKYLKYTSPGEFLTKTSDEIIELSNKFDKKYNNKNIDDKAIIKISVGKN
ncbi:MAG: TIR domain-containing protein [Clostridia bacterium]|nr:TIR domain-containing protein [Clostridia bacterium]